MSNRSFYTAMLSIMFCSAAFAIQPTVRAGSISLNSGIKPAANAITKNTTSAALTAARGSALPKFSGNVVSTGISNNTTQNNALDELRQQINEIKTTQQGLATRDDVNNAIATADLPNANSNLNNALTQIRSTNETLQSSVDSIQQQTDQFSETFNTNVDNRLKVRGLIDSTNAPAFPTENKIRDIIDATAETKGYVTNTALNAKNFVTADSDTILNLATKADIQPATLATNIARDEDAKNALHDAGFTKNSDLTDLVTELDATNLVKVRDLEPFITDTDLDAELITDRLGDTYVKTDKFTKDEIVTKLGDEYVKDAELSDKLAANGVATNESVAALATNVENLSGNVQTLSGNIDTVSGGLDTLSSNVQTLATKVNGGINDEGSVLHEIYTNETIRTALKGDTGPAGADGIQGEKGEKGDSGASFAFRNSINVASTEELLQYAPCNSTTQGHAYYSETTGDMYICGCVNETCQYAIAHIRGEAGATGLQGEPGTRGIDAKPVEQAYCEENLSIVQALYPSAGINSIADCATFPYNYYNAITTGAKAYCLSLAQNATNLDKDTGIGLRLEQKLGTGIVAALKTNGVITKIPNTNQSFMTECEARYNEIMAGEDAETAWHAYCAEGNNLSNIITPLYSGVTNCDQFTSEQYNAIMGGAKAYCLSLAQQAKNGQLDATTGIGKKLTVVLNDTAAISKLQTSGLDTTFTINGVPTKFIPACEEKYNEIMAGEKGDTGEKGDNGDTFVPTFDPTNGKITWIKDNNTTSVNDFDIGSTIDSRAVTAVTNQINTSNSTIANTIGSKIDSKITANNNTLLTVDDLTTLITSGAFKMGCGNKLTIDPDVLDTHSTLKAKYGLSPSKINGPTVNTSVCVQ